MDTPIIRILKLVAALTFTLVGIAWLAAALVLVVAIALTTAHVRIG
jgi:hypothetical protein